MSSSISSSAWLRKQWQVVKGRVRSNWRPHHLYLFDRASSFTSSDAAVVAFGQWCEVHPGAVCEIGLSGRWLLSSVSQIDADHDAAYGHALQQWSHYLDIDQAALESDWVLRQLALPNVSLLCAAPRVLIEGLREQASSHGVRLEWVGPWWTRCAQAWLASLDQAGEKASSQPEFAMYEPGLLTHIRAHVRTDLNEARGARLSDVWTEVTSEAVPASAMQGGACLMPPPFEAIQGLPHESHIWSHSAVADVLQGRIVDQMGTQTGSQISVQKTSLETAS